jgi:hypothetical protein
MARRFNSHAHVITMNLDNGERDITADLNLFR